MAIWGVSFGAVAMVTGMFLLSAVEGGFLAEGFFLIVLSWVMLFFLVARLVGWLTKKDEQL
jgi:tellurite resistance protein TehA-like permease